MIRELIALTGLVCVLALSAAWCADVRCDNMSAVGAKNGLPSYPHTSPPIAPLQPATYLTSECICFETQRF